MKHSFTIFALCLLTSIPGCGGGPDDTPDLGSVSGTIKVDGQPKADLQVQFQPDEGRPSTGKTDDSGGYTLQYSMDEDGAKVGKGLMTIKSTPPESSDCSCCGEGGQSFVDPIPPQWNTNAANNPKLQIEVKPGSNTFDFDIDTSIREPGPAQDCGDGSGCCCS